MSKGVYIVILCAYALYAKWLYLEQLLQERDEVRPFVHIIESA